METKKNTGMLSLILTASSCLFLGAGSLWLVVGVIGGIIHQFDTEVVKPVFWILASTLFVIGLTMLLVSKLVIGKTNK